MKRVLAGFVLALMASGVRADELGDILARVQQLVAEKNYGKALEELSWARKEIEKLNSSAVSNFLPDTLGGLRGGKVENSSALGISMLARTYTEGEREVKLSLNGSSAGGEGLGGLMALGKMAAQMQIPGQESFRIQGRTAVAKQEEGTNPEITVFLDSGGMLQLEGIAGLSLDELRSMVKELKIEELDKYLRG